MSLSRQASKRAEARSSRPKPKKKKLSVASAAHKRLLANGNPNFPKYYTAAEIAKILRMHRSTVIRRFRARYDAGKKGILMPQRGKEQRSLLVSQQALLELMQEAGLDPAEVLEVADA
jgi:DNA invertase Pin-like site-specific DNA recombinase